MGLTTGADAQNASIRFENVSAQLGTLHKHISDVKEDHLGFVWFASTVGLFRFDGYELKEYRYELNDSTSLSSWGVHNIAEDQEGRMWVSTVYGINLLDRRTGEFMASLKIL